MQILFGDKAKLREGVSSNKYLLTYVTKHTQVTNLQINSDLETIKINECTNQPIMRRAKMVTPPSRPIFGS